jgi:hypothetical protein
MQEMAKERAEKMQRDEAWRKFKAAQIEMLIKDLDGMDNDEVSKQRLLTGEFYIAYAVNRVVDPPELPSSDGEGSEV